MAEHSKRDDTLLGKPRSAILFDLDNSGKRPKDSLRILTDGHLYFREHLRKPKPGSWVEVKEVGAATTISDRTDVLQGRVVAIHALRSPSNPMPEDSLKTLTKKRLEMRADSSSITSFTEYTKLRRSCWLIEELEDGQFNCDCRTGFKGKNCSHELALAYKKERIEVLPHATALKLGERRKRGRPKKITMERPREEMVVQSAEEDEPAALDLDLPLPVVEEDPLEDPLAEHPLHPLEEQPHKEPAMEEPAVEEPAVEEPTVEEPALEVHTIPSKPIKRRGRCGECSGCQAHPCMDCKFCKNKKLRKACIRKACLRKPIRSPAPPKGTMRARVASMVASSSKASAKRKRVSPPTSTNTSPVLKPAARRARVMPTSNPTSPTTMMTRARRIGS